MIDFRKSQLPVTAPFLSGHRKAARVYVLDFLMISRKLYGRSAARAAEKVNYFIARPSLSWAYHVRISQVHAHPVEWSVSVWWFRGTRQPLMLPTAPSRHVPGILVLNPPWANGANNPQPSQPAGRRVLRAPWTRSLFSGLLFKPRERKRRNFLLLRGGFWQDPIWSDAKMPRCWRAAAEANDDATWLGLCLYLFWWKIKGGCLWEKHLFSRRWTRNRF